MKTTYILTKTPFTDWGGSTCSYDIIAAETSLKMAKYIFNNLPVDKTVYPSVTALSNKIMQGEHRVQMDRTKEWDTYKVVHMNII